MWILIANNPRNREWDNAFRGKSRQRLLKIQLNTHFSNEDIEIPENAIFQWADSTSAIFTYAVGTPKSLATMDKIIKDELATITENFEEAIEEICNTRLTKEEHKFYFTYRQFEISSDNSLIIKDKNR